MLRNKSKIIVSTLLTSLVVLLVLSTSYTVPEETSCRVFYTADIYGYIKPCG
ncbi:MAG: hypothetical protein ACE5IR_02320 [bacterium]